MELDELHVDELRAGEVRQRLAVAEYSHEFEVTAYTRPTPPVASTVAFAGKTTGSPVWRQ